MKIEPIRGRQFSTKGFKSPVLVVQCPLFRFKVHEVLCCLKLEVLVETYDVGFIKGPM